MDSGVIFPGLLDGSAHSFAVTGSRQMHVLGQDWIKYRVLNLNLKTLYKHYPFVMLSGREFCKSDIIFMMM